MENTDVGFAFFYIFYLSCPLVLVLVCSVLEKQKIKLEQTANKDF